MAGIMDAIKAAAEMELVKVDPNLSPEERAAAVKAKAEKVLNADLMDLGAMGDEAVETRRQVNAIFAGAGIDPVQVRRQLATGGAEAMVRQIQGGDEEQPPALPGN